MITIIRELEAKGAAKPRAGVVIGVPVERIQLAESTVDSVFGPRQIIAYRLRLNQRERLYVFRTLDRPEECCTQVPGVQPRVRLLVCAHTGRRIHRALRILQCVRAQDGDLNTLSDAFFLRAATTLASRAPIDSIVTTLLRQEP